LIASIFLCLFLGPVFEIGQTGLTQSSLETFSIDGPFDAIPVNPGASTE
jgi:hypothetical protein